MNSVRAGWVVAFLAFFWQWRRPFAEVNHLWSDVLLPLRA